MTIFLLNYWLKIYIAWLFLLLSPFGNSMMAFTVFVSPVNELLISVGMMLTIGNWFSRRVPLSHLVLFLFICFIFVFRIVPGLSSNGLIAVRDGIFYLNLFLIVILLNRDLRINRDYFVLCLRAGLIIELLDRVLLGPYLGSTIFISGPFSQVPMFGGTIGSVTVIFANIWISLIYSKRSFTNELFLLISLFLILLHMNRYSYVALLFQIILLSCRGFNGTRYVLVLLYISLGLVIGNQLLKLLFYADIDLRRVFKYYSESGISLWFLLDQVSTIFGRDSADFSGSAHGLSYRINLWVRSLSMLLQSPTAIFLGVGFGIPLTDEFLGLLVMREPHNSFVSIITRLGMIGVIIIMALVWLVSRQCMRFYKNEIGHVYTNFAFINLIAILVMALVQPALELPPTAAAACFWIGLMVNRKLFWDKYNDYQL